MFVPNSKKFPPGVPEISHSQEWDGRTYVKCTEGRGDEQPENITPPATAVAGMEA